MYLLELAGQDDDFAVFEAGSAASEVTRLAPGLATARGVTDRLRHLAFTRRADALIGRTDADIESACALLDAAVITRSGTVAARAEDVRGTTGIDTQRAEQELGAVLVDRGFEIDLEDPDHELRALFSGGDDPVCALGWLAVDCPHDFGPAPTDRPFFQPGSMDADLARAVANVAGARPGATVLDPMCGTGGLLIEAGLVGADVLGVDIQPKMVTGARKNLQTCLGDVNWEVLRGDARRLPVADAAAEAVVFDAPYGRQSKIEGDLNDLLTRALEEARRVAPRCIVVGDRPWARTASGAGWTTEAAFQRPVHRSLTRYVIALRR